MNVLNDLFSATMTAQPTRPPQPEERMPTPPPHTTAIESLGRSMAESTRDSLLASAQELQQSGADFEEVRSFVSTELEAISADVPAGGQSSGQLVDMYA